LGDQSHIQPNPRGRHSSRAPAVRTTGAAVATAAALHRGVFENAGSSPASMRRISAETARNLAEIQPCASRRSAGVIAPSDEAGTGVSARM
jgi:hypothetical protein